MECVYLQIMIYPKTYQKQTVRGDDSMDQSLYSCNDGSNYPTPSETAQERQMVAAGINGLNDTPL
jgi:hypothetical protein